MKTVGIGVEPPLLADLLRRLLWAPDRQVRVFQPSAGAPVCDLAVTSGSLHDTVTAPLRIHLPDDEEGSQWGVMIIDDRSALVPIKSVADILALVDSGLADGKV